jgi:hypothetical protein
VWAVLEGKGAVVANGREVVIEHPGCFALVEHDRHTAGVIELQLTPGVICHAVCFTPGVVT